MKKLTHPLTWIAAIAAAALAFGCTKTDITADEEEETIVPEAAPAPAEEPEEKIAEATPPPRRFAPDGIFHLIAAKSIATDSGIVGLRPGTQVVRQPDGKYVADGHVIELQPAEMTNDLDLAAHYAGSDARAQAAIRERLAMRPPPPAPSASQKSGSDSGSRRPPARRATQSSGARSASALGSSHTMTKNGWLYQKDKEGNWYKVKPLR